ncbi:MAG TPA: hypothetical protein VFK57_21600 [Vicinamibacterales bacterium]|nr:hypothetical protein [Vicinamibacterales bacterium]
MPLIKPRAHRVRTLRHICRLQEPDRDVLIAYAAFIGESADYVLNQLIDTTLAKDRDFVAGRANRESAPGTAPGATSADAEASSTTNNPTRS